MRFVISFLTCITSQDPPEEASTAELLLQQQSSKAVISVHNWYDAVWNENEVGRGEELRVEVDLVVALCKKDWEIDEPAPALFKLNSCGLWFVSLSKTALPNNIYLKCVFSHTLHSITNRCKCSPPYIKNNIQQLCPTYLWIVFICLQLHSTASKEKSPCTGEWNGTNSSKWWNQLMIHQYQLQTKPANRLWYVVYASLIDWLKYQIIWCVFTFARSFTNWQ